MSYEIWIKDSAGERTWLIGDLTYRQASELTRNLERVDIPARMEEQ